MENRITGTRPQRVVEDEEEIITDNPELIKLNTAVESLLDVMQGGLLQKALALSNEKCNSLIKRQTTQVEDLMRQVKNVRESNNELVRNLRERIESVTRRLETLISQQATMKAETAQEVQTATEKAIKTGVELFSDRVNEVTEEVRGKLKDMAKEVEQAKTDIQYERKFRKVFFWVTPALLAVQTIISVFLLLS